jgi:hypothetical protein
LEAETTERKLINIKFIVTKIKRLKKEENKKKAELAGK